jgi:hypothetical protein
MLRPLAVFALAIALFLTAGSVYLSRSHRNMILPKETPPALKAFTPVTARLPLVWFLVDGLGYRDARFSTAAHEYLGILEAESPTKSVPNIFAQLTGTGPATNGVVGNSGKSIGVGLGPIFHSLAFRSSPKSRFSTIFDQFNGSVALVLPSKSTTVVDSLLMRMTSRNISRYEGGSPSTPMNSDELLSALANDADFTLAYLADVDHAGHAGPRGTEAFARALKLTLEFIQGFRETNRSFILTSDHGVLDGGGHGGPETNAKLGVVFLSLPGSQIAAPPGHHRAIDVASTLAVLLGCNAPRQNQGSPIVGSPRGALHPSGVLKRAEAPTLDAPVFCLALVAAAVSASVLARRPETRKPALFVILYYAVAVVLFLFYFGVIDRVDGEFWWGFSQLGTYVQETTHTRLVATILGPAITTPFVVFFVHSRESKIALLAWVIDSLILISASLVYGVSGEYNELDSQSAYRAEHLFLMSIPLVCISVFVLFVRF